jgi:hypothetical protein
LRSKNHASATPVVLLWAGEQAQQEQQEQSAPVVPLSRSSGAQQLAKDQAQIESCNMNQLPLEDVRVLAQVRTPHASGVVAMREAAFDQLSAPSQ